MQWLSCLSRPGLKILNTSLLWCGHRSELRMKVPRTEQRTGWQDTWPELVPPAKLHSLGTKQATKECYNTHRVPGIKYWFLIWDLSSIRRQAKIDLFSFNLPSLTQQKCCYNLFVFSNELLYVLIRILIASFVEMLFLFPSCFLQNSIHPMSRLGLDGNKLFLRWLIFWWGPLVWSVIYNSIDTSPIPDYLTIKHQNSIVISVMLFIELVVPHLILHTPSSHLSEISHFLSG